MKFFTAVETGKLPVQCTLDDRILLLGSCFADEMASRMKMSGFDILSNPFGTLYNPCSILTALRRLSTSALYTREDCVEMGAGDGRVCSFEHHTRFAAQDADGFLQGANGSLEEGREFFKTCNKMIITLGTARIWRHRECGKVVSNCLKRDSREFDNHLLTAGQCESFIAEIIRLAGGRELIFTVSPIRHMGYGASDNTLSKATLQLGLAAALEGRGNACYFPAYELLLDELRDYRFYADDLVHPSAFAVDYICERFLEAATPSSFRQRIKDSVAASKALAHRTARTI